MTGVEELRTARMLLARIRDADGADLCRLHADPRVMATLGGVRSAEETAGMTARMVAHWEAHGFGLWVAREPGTGRFIGRGGLQRAVVGGGAEVEVAYALAAEWWGRGLATELALKSVRVGFAELRLGDLVAFTVPDNRASRRVMEKAGFRYERDVMHAGRLHVLYRTTASAWQAAAG